MYKFCEFVKLYKTQLYKENSTQCVYITKKNTTYIQHAMQSLPTNNTNKTYLII